MEMSCKYRTRPSDTVPVSRYRPRNPYIATRDDKSYVPPAIRAEDAGCKPDPLTLGGPNAGYGDPNKGGLRVREKTAEDAVKSDAVPLFYADPDVVQRLHEENHTKYKLRWGEPLTQGGVRGKKPLFPLKRACDHYVE